MGSIDLISNNYELLRAANTAMDQSSLSRTNGVAPPALWKVDTAA